MADICLTCIKHVQTKAKEKQQTCKVELIPVDAEFIVLTDSSQVQAINGNLLDNTVKYEPLSDVVSILISRKNSEVVFQIENKTDKAINNMNILTR